MKHSSLLRALGPLAAALLAACGTPRAPAPVTAEPAATPPPTIAAQPAVAAQPAAPTMVVKTSPARDARAYRADAAGHIYERNAPRIWKGRLPPMLYAIGVLQVEVGREGEVRRLQWMRAPRHAPEVMAEIEKTVREAAPFPRPARMGKVVWTDTWLWHKSGQFQLDTLTEGQD